jgi:hypothetical protein
MMPKIIMNKDEPLNHFYWSKRQKEERPDNGRKKHAICTDRISCEPGKTDA